MNHGEGWSSGGRWGPRGRSQGSWQRPNRPKSESPVMVDRSLDESSGNRGRRGFQGGGGRCRQSWSPRNNSPVQVYVKKSSQVSDVGKAAQQETKCQEDGRGSADEDAAFNCWGDNKDVLQPSASSSSKNINLSGGLSVSRESEDMNGGRMSYDLVNRMGDVSFSRQVSVSSSTSVEEGDSAHKSGDVGNACNESISKPFDICLEKEGFCLKAGLKELNAEKRRATTKGCTGTVIRPGMILLKNFLSINDQVTIVKKCRELGLGKGGFYQPGYRDGASLHLKMMCLGKNWDPQTSRYGDTRPHDGSIPPNIPFEFNQFVQKAIKDSQSLVASSSNKTKPEDEIPRMSPDICIANFYTSTGKLGLHQDKDESAKSIQKGLPVVSFSIGDSAEFVYSDQRSDDNAEMVVLQSGDVLLFGGKSRKVFHGVRSILKDTAPKVLVQETDLRRPGRLNLTFRQY